jgi:hypothetical protein
MTVYNDFSSSSGGGGWQGNTLAINPYWKNYLSQDTSAPPTTPQMQPQEQSTNYGQSIGDILKFLAGARYNFQGQNIQPQQQIAGKIGDLANAQVDENSPLFQQIYGQERQAGQRDVADSIAEAVRQNRKLSMLGRTPLFSAERGGEQQFRALTQGYQTAQEQARDRARKIIGAGQNAQAGAFNAANTTGALAQQNKASKTLGLGNIADALPLLFKLFK